MAASSTLLSTHVQWVWIVLTYLPPSFAFTRTSRRIDAKPQIAYMPAPCRSRDVTAKSICFCAFSFHTRLFLNGKYSQTQQAPTLLSSHTENIHLLFSEPVLPLKSSAVQRFCVQAFLPNVPFTQIFLEPGSVCHHNSMLFQSSNNPSYFHVRAQCLICPWGSVSHGQSALQVERVPAAQIFLRAEITCSLCLHMAFGEYV